MRKSIPVGRRRDAAFDKGSLTMSENLTGSAKKNLPYHNVLILNNIKIQTVKDQFDFTAEEKKAKNVIGDEIQEKSQLCLWASGRPNVWQQSWIS